MNLLKLIFKDMGDEAKKYWWKEVCIRKWYNPMRYIKGDIYYRTINL